METSLIVKRGEECLKWVTISALSHLPPPSPLVPLSPDGARVASSTGIDILLLDDFNLVINDTTHLVRPPRRGEDRAWAELYQDNKENRLLIIVDRIKACQWFLSCVFLRTAAPWGGGKAEWCQIPGAAALHHPAHWGAPTRQRTWADCTTGGPQLWTPPPREGLTTLTHENVLMYFLVFDGCLTNSLCGW